MVLIGFLLLFTHSIMLFGLGHSILFLLLSFAVSFIFEILGIKTGITFGGFFHYDSNNNGPIIWKVPVFIIITWYVLIYMSFNYVIHVIGFNNVYYLGSSFSGIILISFFSGLLIMFQDLVLDPIGVDEKRWFWKNPGSYYGVPYLNFLWWFLCCFIVSAVFLFILNSEPLHFRQVNKIPLILFSILPIIASRPCFERNLILPACFGIVYSLLLFFLLAYSSIT